MTELPLIISQLRVSSYRLTVKHDPAASILSPYSLGGSGGSGRIVALQSEGPWFKWKYFMNI